MAEQQTKLYSAAGDVVAAVQMPLLEHPPQVVVWGVRTFRRQTADGRYVEASTSEVAQDQERGPQGQADQHGGD